MISLVYFRQSGDGDHAYDRAIQYQCKSDANAKRTFTGINFLSRTALQSDAERQQAINEMIQAAASAGIESNYLQELKLVQWEHCWRDASADERKFESTSASLDCLSNASRLKHMMFLFCICCMSFVEIK